MRRAIVRCALALAGLAALVATTGCVETAMLERSVPPDYGAWSEEAAPRPADGAIWPGSTAGGSFLYFDRKARGIGDLVTVLVMESTTAENQAKTDTSRKTSQGYSVESDVGLTDLVVKPIKWILKALQLSPDTALPATGAAVDVLTADAESTHEGDGKTERSGKVTTTVTCRVVNVLPGNVFHVRGRRATTVNHEQQWVVVEGLVRQEDVGIDNTVRSTQLAEARIAIDGIGVVDDRQRPGFASRALDWIYPF